MDKVFVTTFNKKLYKSYAHKLIETYIETKQETPLIVYVEDDINYYPKNNNITYNNLFNDEPECKNFVERNKHRPVNEFYKDAVRFCYKVFAQNAGRKYGKQIYYVDSDCVFMNKIPTEWFNQILPSDKFLAFYDRPKQYTETGFLAFDNTKEYSDDFFKKYCEWYIKDRVYNLSAFTDCHTLDATRKYIKQNNIKYKEQPLGDGQSGHIMARDKNLNPYIDHRKGNRKQDEHSPEWRKNK